MDMKDLEQHLREDAAAIEAGTSDALNTLIEKAVHDAPTPVGHEVFRTRSRRRFVGYAAAAGLALVAVAAFLIRDDVVDDGVPTLVSDKTLTAANAFDRISNLGPETVDGVLESEWSALESDLVRVRTEVEESLEAVL